MRAPLIGCMLSIGLLAGHSAVAGRLAVWPASQCAQPDQILHTQHHDAATPDHQPGGANIFSVSAAATERAIVSPPLKAQFEKTRALISSLPRVCGG